MTQASRSNSETPPKILKIIVIGGPNVGKRCFLQRYAEGLFTGDDDGIDTDCWEKRLERNDVSYWLSLWNVHQSPPPETATKETDAVIVLFSTTDPESFYGVPDLMATTYEKIRGGIDSVPAALVQTKHDLMDDQCPLVPAEIQALSRELNIPHFAVSAKNDTGIDDVFDMIIDFITACQEAALMEKQQKMTDDPFSVTPPDVTRNIRAAGRKGADEDGKGKRSTSRGRSAGPSQERKNPLAKVMRSLRPGTATSRNSDDSGALQVPKALISLSRSRSGSSRSSRGTTADELSESDDSDSDDDSTVKKKIKNSLRKNKKKIKLKTENSRGAGTQELDPGNEKQTPSLSPNSAAQDRRPSVSRLGKIFKSSVSDSSKNESEDVVGNAIPSSPSPSPTPEVIDDSGGSKKPRIKSRERAKDTQKDSNHAKRNNRDKSKTNGTERRRDSSKAKTDQRSRASKTESNRDKSERNKTDKEASDSKTRPEIGLKKSSEKNGSTRDIDGKKKDNNKPKNEPDVESAGDWDDEPPTGRDTDDLDDDDDDDDDDDESADDDPSVKVSKKRTGGVKKASVRRRLSGVFKQINKF